MTRNILPPDLENVLNRFKNQIFSNLNCMQIGKISKYDKGTQSVEVEIQVKRRINETEIKEYPLLTEIPLFIMQGGGAFLEFPIKKDDYCLVFFNDRDIDNWWVDETVAEPNTLRKHSLSDGFALVGINPKDKPLDLNGENVVLNATGFDLEVKTDKDIIFNEGTDFAVRYNELETAFNQLKQDFDDFVSQIYGLHTHPAITTATVGATAVVGKVTLTPTADGIGSPSSADVSNAKIDNIMVNGVGE